MASSESGDDIDAIQYAMKKRDLDVDKLRDGQRRAMRSYLEGSDTFVVLPTGYGKSIVYQAAPFMEDYRKHRNECPCMSDTHVQQSSIAIVISPLVALMSNQVKKLQESHISAINLATVKTAEERSKLKDGQYSVIYATPESLLQSGTGLLSSPLYRNNVCGIFIDEGHCVAKWGFKHNKTAAFRNKYSRVAELRSYLKSSTPLVILTATASSTVKTVIVNGTGLTNYNLVELSPERTNIKYSVFTDASDNIKHRFAWLREELENRRANLPKVLVFCKLIKNCSAIHAVLTKNPDLEQYVAIFHAVSHGERKQEVLNEFVKEGGKIKCLLATSAFGMGVDVKGLYTVIHYGPSRDMDDYFQESGRVGRDGKQSYAILINYKGRGKGNFNDDMKKYMREKKDCRRKMLVEHYGHTVSATGTKHNCCDICAQSCSCGQDSCKESEGWSAHSLKVHQHKEAAQTMYSRIVSDEEREIVRDLLMKYQQSLVDDRDEGSLYTGTSIASGLPTQLICHIVGQLHTIGNENDLQERFAFFNPAHVPKVWNIINQICASPEVQSPQENSSDSESEESSDGDSNTSLQDYDSDCDELQELIRSQYARVTLPLSSESDDGI